MADGTATEGDPFADPVAPVADEHHLSAATLTVGRNATLTLGTDALIVLDEGLRTKSRLAYYSCGLITRRATTTRSIPFFNILWAEITKVNLTIHYAKPSSAKPSSAKSVHVAYITYSLDASSTAAFAHATVWTASLLDRAYGRSQRQKRIRVLINPFGGTGKAAKHFTREIEPIFAAARCRVDVERTAYSGHAVELAEKLDINAYDVIACASGDGLVHESFNGLARKENAAEALRRVAVVQLPCGSGNAMSWNLTGTGDNSLAALCIVKGLRTPFDLASMTQGEKRTLTFLSQSLGIVAESDLGTENIRWMGSARFTYGFLVRLLGKNLYPCDIAVKTVIEDKKDIRAHYAKEISKPRVSLDSTRNLSSSAPSTATSLPPLRYGTIASPLPQDPASGWSPLARYENMGNFYTGNMAIMLEAAPFFPAAMPSDGLLDLITINGDISRGAAFRSMLAIEKGTFFDMPHVRYRKVEAYRIVPKFGRWAEQRKQATSKLGKFMRRIGLTGGDAAGWDGGFISVDGERMPFEPFQVEVHPGLGTTLSKNGFLYESPGPDGWEDLVPEAGPDRPPATDNLS